MTVGEMAEEIGFGHPLVQKMMESFGIPESLCPLGSSLADRGAQFFFSVI
jgi:hypothetical protein